MSTLYDTYLKEVREFLDHAESMESAIQDTLKILHNQLNELNVLEKKAIELSAKNDMISNDNMHSLELLNCTAVELTQIASRQRSLLVERRRTKNFSDWIRNNKSWKNKLAIFVAEYTLSNTSPRYTYRTAEGFSLVESFNNAMTRMNTSIRKPNPSSTNFYQRGVIKRIVSQQTQATVEEPTKTSEPVVAVKVPALKKTSKHDVSPKNFPLLNQPVSNVKSMISFLPSHQNRMRSIHMGKTSTRYVISKSGNAFVLYDVQENLLLFKTGRLSQLFRAIKAHDIDLTDLSCDTYYFSTIAHYINSSLITKKHHGLDIEFIKHVAITSFSRP